jgi:hypothetical protein
MLNPVVFGANHAIDTYGYTTLNHAKSLQSVRQSLRSHLTSITDKDPFHPTCASDLIIASKSQEIVKAS